MRLPILPLHHMHGKFAEPRRQKVDNRHYYEKAYGKERIPESGWDRKKIQQERRSIPQHTFLAVFALQMRFVELSLVSIMGKKPKSDRHQKKIQSIKSDWYWIKGMQSDERGRKRDKADPEKQVVVQPEEMIVGILERREEIMMIDEENCHYHETQSEADEIVEDWKQSDKEIMVRSASLNCRSMKVENKQREDDSKNGIAICFYPACWFEIGRHA